MDRPDLHKIREAFIEIKPMEDALKVMKLVTLWAAEAYVEKKIHWFCILVHDKKSGCLPAQARGDLYVHVRFQDSGWQVIPPWFFEFERDVPFESMMEIAGIDPKFIEARGGGKERCMETAWGLIGFQSMAFSVILNCHEQMPENQMCQWLHYWDNMSGIPAHRLTRESVSKQRAQRQRRIWIESIILLFVILGIPVLLAIYRAFQITQR